MSEHRNAVVRANQLVQAAMIVIAVFFASSLLIALVTYQLHSQVWPVARLGAQIVYLLFFLYPFALFLIGWFTRGKLELDCGSRRPVLAIWFFVLLATIPVLSIATGQWTFLTGPSLLIRLLFAVLWSLFIPVMTLGHVQIRTRGIWVYTGLWRWEGIASYHWDDSTLVIEPYLWQMNKPLPRIRIAAACLDGVKALVQEHLGPEEERQGAA